MIYLYCSGQEESYFVLTLLSFYNYKINKGFDEKRKDSVFTGEFKLELIPGEWLASFFLDLGLFNREITFDPIVLEKNPFIFDVDKAVEDGQQHLFKISSESDLIDFKSFVFSGDIYYPNGETEKFAISATEVGLILSAAALVSVFIGFVGGALSDHFGRHQLMFASGFLYVISFSLLFFIVLHLRSLHLFVVIFALTIRKRG